MNKAEERRLIKKCIRQDRLAQRMLYEQYKNAMFSTAYRITSDYDLSHDVMQEGFIKVFKNLEKFRGTGTLGSWIKTIIVRAAIRAVQGLHLHVEIEERTMDAEVRFDDNLTGQLLDELLLGLPDKCRVVFQLIEVEGYAHKEVAELLGITTGTSKSQLHYAKRLLKEKLQNRGYEHRKKG